MEKALQNTAYLGNIQYYSKCIAFRQILIEQFDSYQKQTYRNRCSILGANGPLSLTIPIIKNSGVKTIVKDVKIDYTLAWQKNHWRSIFSAYNSSPFFEYYADDFRPFYEKEWTFLLDFNQALNQLIVEIVGLDISISLSTDYIFEFDGMDYRNAITPKKNYLLNDKLFTPEIYSQTFADKFGFVPNLSIIDLLFNLGPETESVLMKCIAK